MCVGGGGCAHWSVCVPTMMTGEDGARACTFSNHGNRFCSSLSPRARLYTSCTHNMHILSYNYIATVHYMHLKYVCMHTHMDNIIAEQTGFTNTASYNYVRLNNHTPRYSNINISLKLFINYQYTGKVCPYITSHTH